MTVFCSFQQTRNVIKPIYVMFSRASSFRYLICQNLFCEDIEVEGHLYIHIPYLEGRHIRHNDLPWPVNTFPGRVYKIWIPIPYLFGLVMHLMLCPGFYSKEPEAFIGITFACVYTLVDSDIRGYPSITMCTMLSCMPFTKASIFSRFISRLESGRFFHL